MAFYKQDIVDINLNTGNIHRSFLNHAIGYKNDDADRFGIRTFRDGVPQDLTGASCQAVFMAPNGSKIALTSYGTVSGNVAYVTLPPACYDYEGQFCLAIQLVGGGVTGTMRIVDGMVVNTGASGTVAPTSSVPTYQEIIAQYDAMVAATAAANGAIAATYSGSATYKVGDYCIHDGGLYRCTTAITTAEAWNAAHWTATKIGPDVSDLKSALNLSTETEVIYFIDGYYIKTNVSTGTTVDTTSLQSSDSLSCAVVSCQPGDVFTITGTGGNTGRLYAFLDSSKKMLDGKAAGGTSRTNAAIVAPANSAYAVFNANISGRGLFCKGIPVGVRLKEASIAVNNSYGLTETHTLPELIPGTTNGVSNGKMSSSGATTSSDDHLVSRIRFQAKAGSFFQLANNSDLVAFSVAIFDAPTGGNLLEIILDTTEKYTVVNDGYAKIDVKVSDPQSRTRSQMLQLVACVIQDHQQEKIAFVSNLSEFIESLGTHRVIHLMDDIVVGGEIVIVNGDTIVYGNGHKISGSASITNYIQHAEGYHEWRDLIVDATYTTNCGIKPNGTAVVKFINCEIYGTDGDGIAPSGSSEVYCYNCKLHDNADEGFSSHDSTYCELHDCEVYHNAYIPFTDEPSSYSSYGGIHLGGSHVGVVQGCYAHHNRGGGINLAPLGQGDLDENMRAYVINNVSSDNVRNGIRLEGLFNCRVIGNTVINNGASGWGGIRVWVGQNTGESTTTSGIIAKNAQALNGVNTVQIDTGADGGITVVE